MTESIKTYNRKNNSVDAVLLNEANLHLAALWCGGRVVETPKASDQSDIYRGLDVPTLAGNLRAELGDYVVRTDRGTFRTQKPEGFEAEYEVAAPVLEEPVIEPTEPEPSV